MAEKQKFTKDELDKIVELREANAQKITEFGQIELEILLANQTTSMLHGENEAKKSEQTAKEVFSENSSGSNLPSVKIKKKDLENGISILDLVILSKLENSKSEVRRLIKGNGVKIDNKIISNEKQMILKKDFQNNFLKLSLGKKRHIKLELN